MFPNLAVNSSNFTGLNVSGTDKVPMRKPAWLTALMFSFGTYLRKPFSSAYGGPLRRISRSTHTFQVLLVKMDAIGVGKVECHSHPAPLLPRRLHPNALAAPVASLSAKTTSVGPETRRPNRPQARRIILAIDLGQGPVTVSNARSLSKLELAEYSYETRRLHSLRDKLFIENAVLFYRDSNQYPNRVVLPRSMVDDVVERMHAELGHSGIHKTEWALRRHYFCPNQKRDILDAIRSYEFCLAS
ncbi:unnamed protein product [Schistocephalus solidus]|uniref:Integrase_H2C2 domain-containing protein n=1 Tax=Schistocephalus solidus TaxID=70667 RepID=A0A183T5X2_SCHSO|nr:unnamed protein product [Schistocephalus solidus]